MKLGFILVTFLAVIHYDYGNDYLPYYGVYKEIVGYHSLSYLIDVNVFKDIGWSIICYVFQYLGGFFTLVAVISIFEGIVYYNAIRRYVPRKLWWFGTFIYLFATSFYLLNFSMLRQGFVVALFFSLFPLIANRKWWIVAPVLYLASFIHGSAIILIPFAFWGYLPIKNSKLLTFIYILIIALLYLSADFIFAVQYIAFDATEEFQRYEEIYSNNNLTTNFGIGFVIYLIPLVVTFIYLASCKENDNIKRLVALYAIGAFFTPLSMYIPMIGRVGYYFSVASVVVLPLAYDNIKNHGLKVFLIGLFIAIKMYDYYLFFNSEVFSKHYKTFHTIFEQLLKS